MPSSQRPAASEVAESWVGSARLVSAASSAARVAAAASSLKRAAASIAASRLRSPISFRTAVGAGLSRASRPTNVAESTSRTRSPSAPASRSRRSARLRLNFLIPDGGLRSWAAQIPAGGVVPLRPSVPVSRSEPYALADSVRRISVDCFRRASSHAENGSTPRICMACAHVDQGKSGGACRSFTCAP